MPDPALPPDVSPEFVALVDRIVATGHTLHTVLGALDMRIATTPPGIGRDNLLAFRRQLVEKIADA